MSCYCTGIYLKAKQIAVDSNGNEFEGSIGHCGVHVSQTEDRKRQAIATTNSDVFIVLENNKVNFNIIPPVPVTVRLSADGWSWLFQSSLTSFQYNLPDAVRTVDTTIHVEVWGATGLLRERDFTVSKTKCFVENNCVLCMDVINNWSCVPTTVKVFFCLFATLALVLMASLIPLAAWLIGTMLALIKWALCGLWNVGKNAHNTRIGKMARNMSKKTAELLEVEEDVEAAVVVAKQQGGPGGRGKYVYTFTIMCLVCLSGVNACDNTISGSFSSQTCTSNGAIEDCEVKITGQMTLQGLGVTSCIKYETPSRNSLVVETKWISMEQVAVPTFVYSTCDWRGHTYASTQCPATSHCSLTGSDDCTAMTSSNIDAFGLLSGTFLHNPGRSMCDSGVGWPFNCFFTGSTCQFARWVIEPLSDAVGDCYDVYKVSSYLRVAGLNVVMRDERNGVIANDTVYVLSGSNTFNLDLNNAGGVFLTYNVLGQFQDVVQGGDLRFLVRNQHTKEMRESSASEPGVPIKSTFGDIQNQNAHFTPSNTMDPNAFLFDPSVATKRSVDHFTEFTFEASGASRMWPVAKKFPFDIGGKFWTYRTTEHDMTQGKRKRSSIVQEEYRKRQMPDIWNVAADVSRPGAVQIDVTTQSGNIMITQVVDSVCPEIQSVAVSGCYNCDIAPAVTIVARSTCMEGSATPEVSGNGLVTLGGIIKLETAFSNHTVKFSSTGAVASGKICLHADSRLACMNFTGILVPKQVAMNNTDMGGDQNNGMGNGTLDFFGSIGSAFAKVFSGLGGWLDWLITLGTILGVVVVVFSVVILSMKLWSMRPKPTHQKQN